MDGRELADTKNLEGLVTGHTNAFIALREGWTSEEVIGKIKHGIIETWSWWLYPQGGGDAVVRINQDGTAEYVGFDADRSRALSFDAQGHVTKQTRGRAYDFSAFFGLSLIPWIGADIRRYHDTKTSVAGLVNQNNADLARRINGIDVYLEGPEGLALIHGKKATPVQIEGNEKFLTAPNVDGLKLLAHYLGANALVSYAQASPARATPVVITPTT